MVVVAETIKKEVCATSLVKKKGKQKQENMNIECECGRFEISKN